MAASVTNSVAIGDSTAAATTLETGTLTPTGSNKVIYVLVGSGATTPNSPTAVKYASASGVGGESLALLDSVRLVPTGNNIRTSVWRLANPVAASGTIHATYGGADDERWIIAVAVQGASGTEGTIAYATATGAGSASATANSTSGELILSFLSVLRTGGGAWTITPSQTSVKELEGNSPATGGTTNIGQFESAGVSSTVASGASTAMGWTFSAGSAEYGLHAFQVNPAAASTTEGSRRKKVTLHPGKHPNKFGKRLRTRRDKTYNLNPAVSSAIVASMAGTGSLAATAQGSGALTSTPAGTGSTSFTVAGAGAMSCSMAGTSSMSASAASAGAMTTSMAGVASSSIIAQGAGAMSASASGLASSTLNLVGQGDIATAPSGTSSFSGILVDSMAVWRGSRRFKNPTHPGKGPLNFLKFKKTTRDKTYGLPTASGAMIASAAGTGALAATATGSGAMSCSMAGTSSSSLTLAGNGAVASTMAGQASSAMTLSGSGAVVTSMAGTGATSLTLAGSGAVSSTMAGTGAVASTLAGSGALQTSLSGSGSVSGSMTGAGTLVVAMAGLGSLQGSFVAGAMVTALVGSGALSGSLQGSGGIQDSLAGSGTLAAVLTAVGAMQTALAGSSTLMGAMTGSVPTTGETPYQIVLASTLIHRAIHNSGQPLKVQGTQ